MHIGYILSLVHTAYYARALCNKVINKDIHTTYKEITKAELFIGVPGRYIYVSVLNRFYVILNAVSLSEHWVSFPAHAWLIEDNRVQISGDVFSMENKSIPSKAFAQVVSCFSIYNFKFSRQTAKPLSYSFEIV